MNSITPLDKDPDATITRYSESIYGTKGILRINEKVFHTLELPWHDNRRNISCIPPGLYKCELYHSSRFKKVYEVTNVPNRSYVLIHAGNYAGDITKGLKSDVRGCILLGTTISSTMILNSRVAIRLFMDSLYYRNSFILSITDNVHDIPYINTLKNTKPVPSGETLDTLSARFESGRKGSLAIGWDSTGGTSYGRYQIAAKTGTFHEFLKFLENSNDPVANEVAKRLESAGNPDGGRHGPVANEWKRLAKENKIQKYEYEFIKKTHYDRSFNKLPDSMKEVLNKNPTLKKVLWSTSVQHGPSGASRIFSKAYEKSGNDPEKLIETIYQERSTKFGRSSPSVRRAVMNRFKIEQKQALNELHHHTHV